MPFLQVNRVRNEFEANLFLQGGIRFPRPYKGDEVISGLHGLTLTFTTPATTITFADATQAGLRIQQVMEQIIADSMSALRPTLRDGVLHLVEATPTTGVVLDGMNSTAAATFGFPASNVEGVAYAPPDGAAPRLINFSDTGSGDGFFVLTEEP